MADTERVLLLAVVYFDLPPVEIGLKDRNCIHIAIRAEQVRKVALISAPS